MAFTPETFVLCSKFNLFKAHANLWIYTTQDTLEDCLAENYFQPRRNLKNQDSPEVGDVIQLVVEGSKLAYLKIVGKTERPYNITVARTFLENEAVIIAELADKASKTTDFATPITEENLGITQAEQGELEEKIDLAANSGRMITAQGLWYAKMYSATVPPSAEDGTNYADFSQTDLEGNPIIVTYVRESGAWVQDQTITPPAEYDGYVPITSKIWDIPEQDGQQGGRILWNHVSKEFTPYPQIISFDSVELTGDSTVDMPLSPDDDNIANVGFVLEHCSFRNIGDIFFTARKDSVLNGAVPCDGTTYQTTDYSGSQAPGALLEANKLPYVSLAQYATLLSTNGSVGVFGWDGIGTTAFRVPSLNDIFIETGTAAQVGDYIPAGAPNITGQIDLRCEGDYNAAVQNASGALNPIGNTSNISRPASSGHSTYDYGIAIDASRSDSIYGNSATIQPNSVRYRAMVQLSTGVRDESYADLATVAFTGSYDDLLNKPTIPDAQIQSDWTQADNTKVDYIKNKPTIPTVNNATITITQGGVAKGSFTTNQGSDATIALDAGGSVSVGTSIDAEIVGTPTISDGDVSNLSYQNYLTLPGKFDVMTGVSSFEIVVAFTTYASAISNQNILTRQGSGGLGIRVDNMHIGFWAAQGLNERQNVTGATTLSTNTKYYAKIVYDGANYTLSLSTDGVTYTQDATAVATYLPGQLGMAFPLTAGWQENSSSWGLGAIHMDAWYVKRNGILVWQGMDAPGLHQRVVKGHEVIEFQAPTSANNYTWYRKYADGWVEQGGVLQAQTINAGYADTQTLVLPVTMADTNYTITFGAVDGNDRFQSVTISRTTTGGTVWQMNRAAVTSGTIQFSYMVSGMAA